MPNKTVIPVLDLDVVDLGDLNRSCRQLGVLERGTRVVAVTAVGPRMVQLEVIRKNHRIGFILERRAVTEIWDERVFVFRFGLPVSDAKLRQLKKTFTSTWRIRSIRRFSNIYPSIESIGV
jgi:hypothetical protein